VTYHTFLLGLIYHACTLTTSKVRATAAPAYLSDLPQTHVQKGHYCHPTLHWRWSLGPTLTWFGVLSVAVSSVWNSLSADDPLS